MKRTLLFLSMMLVTVVAANAQDSTAKKDYVGKYKFPEGSVVADVDVVIDNGVLMMNSSAGTSTLELIKGDTFSITSFNGTAAFKRNDAKKVIGVHIDAGGYVLDGVKDSTASGYTVAKVLKALSAGDNILKGENESYEKDTRSREFLANFRRFKIVCAAQ
jgi:hypothetical protein